MAQRRNSHFSTHRISSQRSLILSGLGCLSILGLLGGNAAIAQAQEAAPTTDSIPSAQDLLQEALPAPEAPVIDSAPEFSSPPPEITIESADLAIPEPLAAESETLLTPPSQPVPEAGDSAYIDSSSAYDLGATPPDRIVLDERSTGCQTILERGDQISAAPCQPAAIASNGSNPDQRSGNLTTVNVGPIAINPSSGRVNWDPSFSIENFLNITPRPIGRLGNGDLQLLFPLTVPAEITSFFGWRVHPIFGTARLHTGTDIGAPLGTPVIAAYGGKVVTADFVNGYGLTVILEHEDGTQETLYAHMSEIFVEVGDELKQGDTIGRVGSTGNSTGPHLHFEFRELTADGWIALSADQALQTALTNFDSTYGTYMAALPSDIQPTSAEAQAKNAEVTSVLQLGRLASKVSLKDIPLDAQK